MSGSMAFTAFLLPMKLSSTKNTSPRKPVLQIASSSAMICSEVLVRGLRPYMTMMSQNSQENGHPRENCSAMWWYASTLSRS